MRDRRRFISFRCKIPINLRLSLISHDAGASVRELLNSLGAVTDTYAYDAFGNTVAQTGSTVNEFLYRGEQFDTGLGMYYLRARGIMCLERGDS